MVIGTELSSKGEWDFTFHYFGELKRVFIKYIHFGKIVTITLIYLVRGGFPLSVTFKMK
jgi:hypothetical protein